jgi:hypothetical protein
MAWPVAPPFDVAAMLMHADRGGVYYLQIAVISLRHRLENPVPHTDLGPASEPVGAGRGWAIALWDVSPGRARPKPPVDAVQDFPVICPGHTSWLVRQQRLDDRPLEVGQFLAAGGHRGTSGHLESSRPASFQDLLWVRDLVRITGIRKLTKPISLPIRNAYIDFSKMTISLVAVVVNVQGAGKRPFDSNGRACFSSVAASRTARAWKMDT